VWPGAVFFQVSGWIELRRLLLWFSGSGGMSVTDKANVMFAYPNMTSNFQMVALSWWTAAHMIVQGE
jgi:hypothetical protein